MHFPQTHLSALKYLVWNIYIFICIKYIIVQRRGDWTVFVFNGIWIASLKSVSVQRRSGLNYVLNAYLVWIMLLTLFGVKDVLIWREAGMCSLCVCVSVLFWLDDSPGTEIVITIC